MAGIRYSEVFLFMASTSASRLGSKVARETRTTAAAGNDSVMVFPFLPSNHLEFGHREIPIGSPTRTVLARAPRLKASLLIRREPMQKSLARRPRRRALGTAP